MEARSKKKELFALSLLAIAVSQAAYGGVDTLPEVSVTSTTIDDRFDSKRGEPSNINNISGEKVDYEHGKNIVEVLEAIPGVTAEIQSGDSVKIMLRGIEAQRYMGEKPGVAIVIDGVPVFERTGRVNIDLDNIESIKVIKGGASYLFGEDALSGAVVITTKRGAKMAGITAATEKGSFHYHKKLLRAGFAKNNWIGHLQGTERKTDGYHDQGGSSADYIDGKLQYLIDESSDIAFGFEQSKRAKDSHGTITGVTNARLDPRSFSGGKDYARMYDVNLDKMNVNYAKDFGAGGNLMAGVYQYLDHTIYKSNPNGILRTAGGAYLYGTSAASDMKNFKDTYASLNDGNQVQQGFKSEWRKGGETAGLMVGVDLRKDQDRTLATNLVNYTSRTGAVNASNPLNLTGAITADNKTTSRTKAAYGEMKWQVATPLTATLNARYDNINSGYESYIPLTGAQITAGRVAAGQKTFNVWSERVGLNYALSPQREIYTNISNGFRVPTISQLYGGSVTPTGSVTANPNLTPEKSWNKEIGLRTKSELFGVALDTDVAVFQLERKNFILNTGGQYQTAPDATPSTFNEFEQYQNIGGVRNRGIELGIKTDAKRAWSGDIAYTYLDAKFTRNDAYWMSMGSRTNPMNPVFYNNTGNVVPRTPRHKANLSTRYRHSDALSFTAEVNAQSGFFADEVNKVYIGGRTLFNVMANYDIKTSYSMKWSAFARVDNLFNRFYYTTIRGGSDGNGDGVYNAEDMSITVDGGRVWTAGLSLAF